MTNLIHQFAGDARAPRGFQAGAGPVQIELDLGTDNLNTGDVHKVFKFAKAGFVGNFAIKADTNMDSHATPTLVIDVGDVSNPDKFIDGATAAQAYAGYYTNAIAETTIAGTAVAADSFIVVDIDAGAATAVAGKLIVSFDYTQLEN